MQDGRPDKSTAGAGVLVAGIGGVLVPGRCVERSAGSEASFSHLSDSLSNLGTPLLRLVTALDELGGLENLQVSKVTREAIVAQTGAVDSGLVRLEVKENRKLSPVEVTELVEAYKAGASQRELTRRFGLHEQTVRAHLKRQGVSLRPLRVLTEAQEVEVVRLYVEEIQTLAELVHKFGVGEGAVRNILVRRGVARRGRLRRQKD